MDDGDVDPGPLELTRDSVGAMFRSHEHEHARHSTVLQTRDEDVGLALGGDRNRLVRDPDRGDCWGVGTNDVGVAQEFVREPDDLRGHRRGEEHRLAGARKSREDPSDIGEEPHVQHAVRFVQYEDLERVEVDVPPVHMIEQATGCRDDDLGAATEGALLVRHPDAAVDRSAPQSSVSAESMQESFRLEGQLSRRREYEGVDPPAGVRQQSLEDGK